MSIIVLSCMSIDGDLKFLLIIFHLLGEEEEEEKEDEKQNNEQQINLYSYN